MLSLMAFSGCSALESLAASALAVSAPLDGEPILENIQFHLENCLKCQSLVASLLATNTQLLRVLYRRFCPNSEPIVLYSRGLLEQGACARVEDLVHRCPCCAEEVQVSRQVLEEVSPP